MFGRKGKVPNLHNSSKPSIADHVATSFNAVCVLNEYRNDKAGRTRMNMDKDKKKDTSKVNQGIIVCGQQIATAGKRFNTLLAPTFSFKKVITGWYMPIRLRTPLRRMENGRKVKSFCQTLRTSSIYRLAGYLDYISLKLCEKVTSPCRMQRWNIT